MFCTACATANARSADRCGGCGAALRGGAARRGGIRAERGRRRGEGDGHRHEIGRRGAGGTTGRGGRLLLALLLVLPLAGAAISGGFLWAERGERAAAYDRGLAALAAGDPESALAAFADARGHADAAARRGGTEAALAPLRPLYLAGLDALARGDTAGAVAALLPVAVAFPAYRDAASLLDQARATGLATLREQAAAAERAADWLAAERALVALAAADPAEPDHAAALAALRRDHAPILFGWQGRLLMVGPDGRDQHVVTEDIPVAWPVWSPDRTQVAFVSPEDAGPGAQGSGGLALYVVGVEGAGLRRLGGGLRPYEPPVWSPDGTRIAFLGSAGPPEPEEPFVTTIDPNFAAYFGSSLYFDLGTPRAGATPVVTPEPAPQPGPTTASLPAPALGPGGSPSFDPTPASRGPAPTPPAATTPAAMTPLTTPAATAPPPAAEGPTAQSAQTAQTAAIGTTGAIGSTVEAPTGAVRAGAATGSALYVVDVATGRVDDPVAGRVAATTSPAWSPGSDRIAFVSRPAEELDQRLSGLPEGELYVVDLVSGSLAPPARGAVPNPWKVAWSPAAGAEALIVWSRGPGQPYDAGRSPLTLVEARTGRVTDLNPGMAKVTMPVWSPDGGRIAYIENDLLLRVRAIPGLPGVSPQPPAAPPGHAVPAGAGDGTGGEGDVAATATAIATTAQAGNAVAIAAGEAGAPGGSMAAAWFAPDAADQLVVLAEAPSEFLTWAPDGSAVLLAGGGRPSQIVRLTGPDAGIPRPFLLVYDTNRRQGSPPQWGPLAPAPGPRPATTGGTARDV